METLADMLQIALAGAFSFGLAAGSAVLLLKGLFRAMR